MPESDLDEGGYSLEPGFEPLVFWCRGHVQNGVGVAEREKGAWVSLDGRHWEGAGGTSGRRKL